MPTRPLVAHHEAGHAVTARVLKIDVPYATLLSTDPCTRSSVMTSSAAYLAPNDPLAREKDAMVAFAGPAAQERFRPMTRSQIARAGRTDWASDFDNARSMIGAMLLLRHGEPLTQGAVEFHGERGEEFSASLNRVWSQAAALVAENWPAIVRVASALLTDRVLDQDELDALIGDRPPERRWTETR